MIELKITFASHAELAAYVAQHSSAASGVANGDVVRVTDKPTSTKAKTAPKPEEAPKTTASAPSPSAAPAVEPEPAPAPAAVATPAPAAEPTYATSGLPERIAAAAQKGDAVKAQVRALLVEFDAKDAEGRYNGKQLKPTQLEAFGKKLSAFE